jgi:hypothetical protein
VRVGQRGLLTRRANPNHERVTGDPAALVAADHEGAAADHPFLDDVVAAGQRGAHPLEEPFVGRHLSAQLQITDYRGSMTDQTAEGIFAELAGPYLAMGDVTAGTGFGRNPGLRRDGHIFAMLVRGSLVVKLPREVASEMVASGRGVPFDPGHGRLMREWVEVSVERVDEWPPLVRDAYDFAARRS